MLPIVAVYVAILMLYLGRIVATDLEVDAVLLRREAAAP